MSTGGSAIDRTWEAHEDNVDIAEEAARVVGLDVAGIDFLAPDITKPVRETGGAIIEVNAAPGFRMHTNPTEGEPQFAARPVDRPALPTRTPLEDPDRGCHRLERQDDDRPDDLPHHEGEGAQGRLDLDRRDLHR
jgi:cyanophycin synthetase